VAVHGIHVEERGFQLRRSSAMPEGWVGLSQTCTALPIAGACMHAPPPARYMLVLESSPSNFERQWNRQISCKLQTFFLKSYLEVAEVI
jgi:hypothetical protein